MRIFWLLSNEFTEGGMMIVLLRATLLALAFFSTQLESAFAQPASSPEPMDTLRVGGVETYADLVRLVVPGIVVRGGKYSGGQVIDVRHIDGLEMDVLKPASAESLHIEAIAVRSGGFDRKALLLDFGDVEDSAEGFVVLALFDVTDEPRLLDAVNVALDRFTSFLDPVRLPVGEGNDLLMTRSVHFNSNQQYAATVLVLVRNDRFELVDTIFTFGESTCAYERTQELDVGQGSGEPFADIAATVTERTTASGECAGRTVPQPGTRAITVTYRWDAAIRRYVPDSDAFAVLARENEKRF